MDTVNLTWIYLTAFMCLCAVTGTSIGTSNINCVTGSDQRVGSVTEGYTGAVEVVNGIPAGTSVTLETYLFQGHINFLELNFTLGDTSAIVQTKKPLDADADALADSYGVLYYSVTCQSGADSVVNSRFLELIDENDNSPIFNKPMYNKELSESLSVDSEVLKVVATDADVSPEYNTLSYSIVSPGTPYFIVNNAGAIILKKRLNYNLMKNFNFTVEAKDIGGQSDSTVVLFDVIDFDNLNPYFNHNLYHASIHENQRGQFDTILPEAIKAQDGDTGINMTVAYSISTVSPSKYQSNFIIDASSGVISVVTAIDREELESNIITVSIKAAQADDELKTAGAVVSVTVEDENDNAPEFDQSSYSVPLLENSPIDTVVLRVVLTDQDQGGFNGTLRILPDPESVPFSVSSDGAVRVKNSAALDRETSEIFIFQIEARETEAPNHVVVADVNVTLLDENDNSPTFEHNTYEGKVDRNQTEGMLVTQVKAVDPDKGPNGEVKYAIDFGNQEGYFSIDENNGRITLNKTIDLQDNKILEFSLYVTARDGGEVSRSSSVLVNVRAPGDSKPQFLESIYSGSIEEEQEPAVIITKVSFLAITSVPEMILQVDTHADKFAIDSNGVFSSTVKLDYDEAPRNYSVSISISDGVTTDTAVVEVQVTDINDNGPVFASSSVTEVVPEDAEVGINVTDVVATDKDSGVNGEIKYFLQGGEGKFSVDPDSGTVSLAGELDREAKAEYSLVVVALDQGYPARSATATLIVQVSDINDHTPMFTKAEYEVEVLETESVGKELLTLSAVDPDKGANGTVTYHILQQNPPSTPGVFLLDSSTGVLSLNQTLDYSETKVYSLVVQAADGGSPSLVGNGSVVVMVHDVNNNPPQFNKDNYDVAVSESLSSGSSIVTLEVTDRDEGGFTNGFFLYTSDTFEINQQGVVSLRKDATLDRETKDNYIIQVVAVDQPVDGLNATAQLNVTVLDFNDNSPQFPHLDEPLLIPEGQYSDMSPWEVIKILATDADLGPNGEVTLSLPSPNPLFRFIEDGTLLAVGALDRESRDSYDLVIKASDGGTPQRENFTTVTVRITDINDNRPVFSASTYTNSILVEDSKEGDVVLKLSATDKDSGNNSLISYSFSEGASPYLAVDSVTGAVTLTSDLADVTEDTKLELTAMAKDHGHPPLNSTAGVVINLRLTTLTESVAFESSSYNFSLPENQPMGTAVGAVKAAAGIDQDVSYTLKTHTDLFSIDASGALTAIKTLDKETQDWYILEVEAVDTRVPPTSAVALVRVQVEDVNEMPQFSSESYNVKIYSIAPYKSPVIQVKATDPDVGDSGQLVYSLSAASDYFDIDHSTGLVFVVSVTALAGEVMALQVKATDPRGLFATTKVEVEVQGTSSSDVVVISINQPANIVEKKVAEMEESLGKALGWTVKVIDVSGSNTLGHSGYHLSRESSKSFISFISIDEGNVISSEVVTEKLKSESATVKAELEKVFGEGLQHEVEEGPSVPPTNQATVIALGVLLALSMLGLLLMMTFTIIKFRRMKKHPEDPYKDMDIDIGRINKGYINTETETTGSETSERARSDSKSSQVVQSVAGNSGTENKAYMSGEDETEMGKDSKSSKVETDIANGRERASSHMGETSDSSL